MTHTSAGIEECLRMAKEEYRLFYGSAESGPLNHAQNGGEGGKVWASCSRAAGIGVCALSDKPVGISVKRMVKREYYAVSSRFFGRGEATGKRYRFYKLWTAKAALAALTGENFPDALRRRDYRAVSHFDFLYGYALSVAGEGKIYIGLIEDKGAQRKR